MRIQYLVVGVGSLLAIGCTVGHRIPITREYQPVGLPGEMRVFADEKWQEAPFKIERADLVRITASGSWAMNYGLSPSGPEGNAFTTFLCWAVPPFQLFSIMQPKPSAPVASLIAELQNGKRVAVGREYCFENRDDRFSGTIHFMINDHGQWKNSGAVKVRKEAFRKVSVFTGRPGSVTGAPPVRLATDTDSLWRPPERSDTRPRFAVIVGIGQYRNEGKAGLTNLVYADRDAEGFAAALRRQGWRDDEIRMLVNEQATKNNIQKALDEWLTKADRDSLIVLFWAGHGYPDLADPERVYFACHDTDLASPSSGFRMDRARRALAEHEARNVVVLVDTCHAGKFMSARGRSVSVVPRIERLRHDTTLPKGWVFMGGADTDRKAIEDKAWTNGAFTHCLLEGLSGRADGYQSAGPKDGIVTMGELRAWLESTMPDETLKVLGAAKRPVITTSSGDPGIWGLTLRAK